MKKLISKARAVDREEGFSLAELMVAFIILALIVFAAFNLLDVNFTAGSTYMLRADISQELRETSDAMVDQLRTANSFQDAQGDSVTFRSYLTGTEEEYNVQFLLDGNDVIHRVNTNPLSESDNKILASDVTGLQLTYYDDAGSVLGSPNDALSSIAMIHINITMHKTDKEVERTDSIDTMVRVRN